ncbi:hypothetical protein BDR05DRAFT_79989 [Suillus weaverae]|nr:hypothetical protein BDR05DRAFT_79989 [Suillus weaverae]
MLSVVGTIDVVPGVSQAAPNYRCRLRTCHPSQGQDVLIQVPAVSTESRQFNKAALRLRCVCCVIKIYWYNSNSRRQMQGIRCLYHAVFIPQFLFLAVTPLGKPQIVLITAWLATTKLSRRHENDHVHRSAIVASNALWLTLVDCGASIVASLSTPRCRQRGHCI